MGDISRADHRSLIGITLAANLEACVAFSLRDDHGHICLQSPLNDAWRRVKPIPAGLAYLGIRCLDTVLCVADLTTALHSTTAEVLFPFCHIVALGARRKHELLA